MIGASGALIADFVLPVWQVRIIDHEAGEVQFNRAVAVG